MGEREVSLSNVDSSHTRSAAQWSCPDGIMVCARLRPLTSAERADPNVQSAVECLKDDLVVNVGLGERRGGFISSTKNESKLLRFPFHRAFHHSASQEEVFLHICAGIVRGAMEGINGAVMAYGATGSGKTHSMFGGESSTLGVIFQAAQNLIHERSRLQRDAPEKSVRFKCSFVEVYKEEVYDLLHPLAGRTKLAVRAGSDATAQQNNAEAFELSGISYAHPTEFPEFVDFIQLGLHNRAVACTKGNAQSSRSHAIVTIEVEIKNREDSTRGTLARLRFCDLAGCERAAQHQTLKAKQEGAKINQSLLELGCVMQGLARRSKERAAAAAAAAAVATATPVPGAKKLGPAKVHVSWRGSKLTRLMRDCLEGNCRTAMLICVSPTSIATDDTRRAMEFAMKAKEVQLTAKPNEYQVDTPEVAKEQAKLIERLRQNLESMSSYCKNHGFDPTDAVPEEEREFVAHELGLHLGPSGQQGSPLPRGVSSLFEANQSLPSPTPLRIRDVKDADAAEPPQKTTASISAESSVNHLTTTTTVVAAAPPNQTKYALFKDRVTKLVDDKNKIHGSMKEISIAKEKAVSSIRRVSVQIAEYLARGGGNEPPPLSIVNAERELRTQSAELDSLSRKFADLEVALNTAEMEISTVRNQMQREGSDFFTELILQFVNAVESVHLLEAMSAQYLQEKISLEMRMEEHRVTQDRLTTAVHSLIKFCPADDPARRQAAVAIAFAEMTKNDREALMLEVFRAKLSGMGFSYGNHAASSSSLSSSAFHISGNHQTSVTTHSRGGASSSSATKRKSTGGGTTPPAVSLMLDDSASGNNSFAKTMPTTYGGGNSNNAAGGTGKSTATTPTSAAGGAPSSGSVAFGRSATAISSLAASSLSVSPAMFSALQRNKSASNRASMNGIGNSSGSSTATNGGGVDNAAASIPKKPPVPFTSAAFAAAAAAAAANSSSLAMKTPSGGNTLLGIVDPRIRVAPSSSASAATPL
ncbi:kinesin, putative [Bodo saltans]|uniref:Kinesin, putative n=1 Tax=Bodo saltans TaxID=75058 RepID=A0A0S4IK33_BODSA|nr:kinesin, putative [Bodo saltans]|eukprot:CUE62719.1 kinesin, putative [Bodo saltans]